MTFDDIILILDLSLFFIILKLYLDIKANNIDKK